MPVTINGDGSITGLSVGGLPNGTVDTDTLATDAVTNAKIADLLSGGSVDSGGAVNIGGIRIQYGKNTTDTNGINQGGASTYGYSCTWHHSVTISLSGFASTPLVVASVDLNYHEIKVAGIYNRSSTGADIRISASREAGVENIPIHWVAIGEAS
tara:strand:- start:39 stop:503 length:465 start_codon:yes stop_codon:yes gene_type:complete